MHFTRCHPDERAGGVVKALTVDATPPVDGRWHWINAPDVHYRPEKYWAAGTKIIVQRETVWREASATARTAGNATKPCTSATRTYAIADNKTHHDEGLHQRQDGEDHPGQLGHGRLDRAPGPARSLLDAQRTHVVIREVPVP